MRNKCGICGRIAELSFCWKCGRAICEKCFDSELELCIKCKKGKRRVFEKPGKSELYIPESAKPTSVSPEDIKK